MGSRSEQVTAVGGALAGVGATFAAGYWIYALQENKPVWAWQMWSAVSIVMVGILMMLWSLAAGSESGERGQSQRGGKKSINYQAGRDISVRRKGGRE